MYSPFEKILNLFKNGENDHSSPLLDMNEVCKLYVKVKKEPTPEIYFPEDLELYKDVSIEVKKGNLNNITRTACYLDFYRKHPEIHWSFLAHMVSRNAGYHMTDLRNDLLSHVLNDREQRTFFSFLELCNAAIFQDAYPQLLLYDKWKVTGRSSFHLLKKFNVSLFMRNLWNEYLKAGNQQILTLGLIMNEQHMIERRILSDPNLNTAVEKWMFFLQDRLEFASILFPYGKYTPYSLAGLSVSHFEQVKRRILLGKKLYGILFHQNVYPTAFKFSIHRPHTGSREDYWPHVYSKEQKKTRLFSPLLASVWENSPPVMLSSADWFTDQTVEVMTPLLTISVPEHFSMTKKWKARTSILMHLKRD